ncbi:hypothetical protein [Limnobacter alexandrii]|uniref:hypothetical protein n=1 Tax=Limnobacter alexandrii TaxID=2570352 RepID=UPI0011083D77|nr:hypothetical protein [Limnobacter alexandrii]
MENGSDWATVVQAAASVIALALAVFMPRIQKAADRRENGLAIVRIFKLSIREIHTHVIAMGDVLSRRQAFRMAYGVNQQTESAEIILKEVEHVVESQIRLLSSVGATDLPVPGMAVMGTALQRSFIMLKSAVGQAIEEEQGYEFVFKIYLQQRKMFHDVIVECDRALDKIEKDLRPNPMLARVNQFFSRIGSLN